MHSPILELCWDCPAKPVIARADGSTSPSTVSQLRDGMSGRSTSSAGSTGLPLWHGITPRRRASGSSTCSRKRRTSTDPRLSKPQRMLDVYGRGKSEQYDCMRTLLNARNMVVHGLAPAGTNLAGEQATNACGSARYRRSSPIPSGTREICAGSRTLTLVSGAKRAT